MAGGVTVTTAGGFAHVTGVATCGKVHLCPVCAAKIRSARSAMLQRAGTAWEEVGGEHQDVLLRAKSAWIRIDKGTAIGDEGQVLAAAEGRQAGGLGMLTLTLRHYERHTLKQLLAWQREAWKRSLGQNAGRAWRMAKVEYGVAGFVRAWEVTYGENGWHPHWHILVLFEQPLTPERGAALEELIYQQWAAALRAVGAYLPDREHGVKLDLSGHGEGGALARYLMKYQDGKAAWTTAAEMTRQDIKAGREGHLTPFEIARSFLVGEPDPVKVGLWREYETDARGMRALYFSNGLKKRLALICDMDERTDDQIAAEEAKGEPLAVFPAEVWHRHVVRHRGRSLALLRAAEKLGTVGVRTLAESWGLTWGQDVLDPPPPPAD
ncbi:protein rep [Kitasatospora acidiphila]|uniref:protein rep n=1 Tax=Kitasatospora acidiphila TaxID=2567942 RepID=UPI003C714BF0